MVLIDLSADMGPRGKSNDDTSGPRSNSSRRLTGHRQMRSKDLEEQGQDPSLSSCRQAQIAVRKVGSRTAHRKAKSIKATSRTVKDNEGPEALRKKGKRQASPVVLSVKKILSTKAVLKVARKMKRSSSRSGTTN